MRQRQFLEVVSPDVARERWRAVLALAPAIAERVPLVDAHGRITAEPVTAPGDVPAFDRANMDGFAVQASDLYGAEEHAPVSLQLRGPALTAGPQEMADVAPGEALAIATGAPLPRGADAVIPVEDTLVEGDRVTVQRAIAPGHAISTAGSDIARGERILMAGVRLSARETGVLAACGIDAVACHPRPVVGVLSTGNEIVPPGSPLPFGAVHDANMTLLCDAIRELGAEPRALGVAPDERAALTRCLDDALASCDALLLSGGTSKGAGDLSYEVLAERCEIVVHGVALKPGKPLCLAHHEGKPVVALPGFPTSAIFTFHAFVAPVLATLGGARTSPVVTHPARLLQHVRSERGRMDFQLVSLLPGDDAPIAVPLGRGSGSVTTFARADAFFALDADVEFAEAGETIQVTRIGKGNETAALTIVGSHCVGLDHVLEATARRAWPLKVLAVGSRGGLDAAAHAACDVAPIHLFDAPSGSWNRPFLPPDTQLVRGYIRQQGIAMRRDTWDEVNAGSRDTESVLRLLLASPHRIANRNPGSGTRVLLDGFVAEHIEGTGRPAGWSTSYRTHTAVAAAVAQGRADFGICLEQAAAAQDLVFLPWRDEHYDFVIPNSRRDLPGVQAFFAALEDPAVIAALEEAGFQR